MIPALLREGNRIGGIAMLPGGGLRGCSRIGGIGRMLGKVRTGQPRLAHKAI